MKLIVGLGNPGRQYERTRHNAGFMAADALVRAHAPAVPVRAKFQADVVETDIGAERCLVMKPMTYMNRSGSSVGEALRFYKLDPRADLLVITDDIYLPLGHLRLRPEGGSGGHNGLIDVARALGADAYARLRIGVGEKPSFMDQADYVLSRFTEDEWPVIEKAAQRAAEAAVTFVREGLNTAMNRFNGSGEPRTRRPRPAPPAPQDEPSTEN